MASTAAHGGGESILALLLSYWWVFLLFGGGILEWIAETFDVGVTALQRRAKRRHKERLQLRRLELEIAQAKAGVSTALAPVPGPCRHRKAVPVRSEEGDIVAWLCRSCDTQLPADFSIYEEDL